MGSHDVRRLDGRAIALMREMLRLQRRLLDMTGAELAVDPLGPERYSEILAIGISEIPEDRKEQAELERLNEEWLGAGDRIAERRFGLARRGPR